MFTRNRAAFAISVLFSLLISISVFAKGGFDFISITGPNLKEAVRVSDTALTEDFFTFANFYEDKTKAPADAGEGYEILRYYVDGKREIVFDRLHYYPETGFVFYDGIENGESEYDDEWYIANPETKAVFESALSAQMASAALSEKQQPISSASQPDVSNAPSQSVPSGFPSLPVIIVLGASGITALLLFVFWRRKPAAR